MAGALTVWGVVVLVITTSLAMAHWVALPRPEPTNPQLSRAIAALRPSDDARWQAVHVFYAHCRCSLRLIDHLTRRRALPELGERVLLVGQAAELSRRLSDAGYQTHEIGPKLLATGYGIASVPMLIVSDPDDHIRYAAGYTTHQQGPDPRDVSIIRGLIARQNPGVLPVFGCAVSRSLQLLLDPFALKYDRREEP